MLEGPGDDERPDSGSPGRLAGMFRRVALDTGPLRASRDFRLLWAGQFVSTAGRQITITALPLQVFLLTRSSFSVGLIGLVQLVPLVPLALYGGTLADRLDRRKMILLTEAGLAGTSLMLLAGAVPSRVPVWYLYLAAAIAAGLGGMNSAARSAVIPNVVGRDRLASAMALNQLMWNTTMMVGPAIAGLIVARLGFRWAYGTDVATFAASIGTTLLISPQRPRLEEGRRVVTGWPAVREGFAFLRGRRALIATFVIDLDAMIFGMPRALFPQLVNGRALAFGLLSAAPAAGALLAALTAGWVGRVRRQGLAVLWAVAVWGVAIAAFGMVAHVLWLAMVLLAAAGGADVISAVFRGTILQFETPDALRGRLSSIHNVVVTGGPRLGDFESGAVALFFGAVVSAVSGGLACVAGVLAIAGLLPELARYQPRYGGAHDESTPR